MEARLLEQQNKAKEIELEHEKEVNRAAERMIELELKKQKYEAAVQRAKDDREASERKAREEREFQLKLFDLLKK